jgi:5'-3' exonuclease
MAVNQPIPQRIIETKPEMAVKKYNTLLIDGSNLLEVCFAKDKKLSSNGLEVGAIFQFLLQIKILLQKGNFRYVYAFFDGERSGQLRFNLNCEYKLNRDKTFEDSEMSDYMKEVNARVKWMEKKIYKKPKKTEDEKECFFRQKNVILKCLDELFIRTLECEYTEADDFIGYYVTHKRPEERIVIISNDRDLTQLISEDVIVYIQSKHDFINTKNHTDKIGYNYQNVLLKKMICGDDSDNIKGIKGVGEKTLFTNFPEFTQRKVTLDEVIDKARKINEDRVASKKKPLKWAENIVNRVTDGCQGEKVYEINEKIIDLKKPLMTDDAIELIESFMYAPIDPEGRSMSNLYNILLEAGVDDLKDETIFGNFFTEFNFVIDNEKKLYEKNGK